MTTKIRLNEVELAEKLSRSRAGQSWASPQEMDAAKSGDHSHGEIDECVDACGGIFLRVWHDGDATWYTVPETVWKQRV